MQSTKDHHTFHIPVMGTGFTIDTPAKVAHFGISSVVSLVDDILAERMRESYSKKLDLPYEPITDKNSEDPRAQRITAYLNLLDKMVRDKFAEVRQSLKGTGEDLQRYMDLLPDFSDLKRQFREFLANRNIREDLSIWIDEHIRPGNIDVNIMTKLDKDNYRKGQKLPNEFNDAHAALRGYAQSVLNSAVVFSAGINPRLYGYIETFDDFYPDADGEIKKKIILKVSDYRSALIQGRFLAKKGLWVSEYRIESGLNCGGHAFATDGYLLGPVLEEFRARRQELVHTTHAIVTNALAKKRRSVPSAPLPMKITAQGGVGTAEEHRFLIEHYGLDSVGWGTPFLLVPEATNVDKPTLDLLCRAKEEDLYISATSPLGVPFNSVKGNTKDIEKEERIAKGRPGSSCPRKLVQLNTEFTTRAICSASRQYQNIKIKKLDESGIDPQVRQRELNEVTDKSCICVGLGTSALIVNDIDTKVEGKGVSVCPGPGMAYFDKILSLREMIDHIYGRANVVDRSTRPSVFVKELQLYVGYLKSKIAQIHGPMSEKQTTYFRDFQHNLNEGIDYYIDLFSQFASDLAVLKENVLGELEEIRKELQGLDLVS